MRENGDGGGNKSSKRKEEIDKIMEVGKEILKMEDKDDEKSMEIMLEQREKKVLINVEIEVDS